MTGLSPFRYFLLLAGVLLALSCTTELPAAQSPVADGDLIVRRGDFADVFLLSGEFDAPEGAVVAVPPLPSWQSSIKWMVDEGAQVAEGDPVVELDASEFASSLESRHSTLTQAQHELAQKESELKASLAEKEYELEKRRADLEKAKLEAAVPPDLISRREAEDRRLGLQRAQTEWEKARSSYEAEKVKGESDLRNLQLAVEKAQREVDIAESAIRMLTLRAPRTGIVVIGEHPWEGRKLQIGDTVFVSMPLAQIPDLSSLQVVGMLPDVDDGKIAAGMPATLTIDAYPDRKYAGTVSEIAPVAQEIGRGSLRRGFRVIVPLEEVDHERMRPGLSVLIEVERRQADGVLLAPRVSLDVAAGKARLANGREVDVKVGPCNAQECVVAEGLDERARLAPWRMTAGGAV
ncbi:MAG: HlyD family secretion protein [Thermoanaerobaculia bacterium]